MKRDRKFFGHWLCSGDTSIPSAIYQHRFARMGDCFCRWLISSTVHWFFLVSVARDDLCLPLPQSLGPWAPHAWTSLEWEQLDLCVFVASSSPFRISSSGLSDAKETAALLVVEQVRAEQRVRVKVGEPLSSWGLPASLLDIPCLRNAWKIQSEEIINRKANWQPFRALTHCAHSRSRFHGFKAEVFSSLPPCLIRYSAPQTTPQTGSTSWCRLNPVEKLGFFCCLFYKEHFLPSFPE